MIITQWVGLLTEKQTEVGGKPDQISLTTGHSPTHKGSWSVAPFRADLGYFSQIINKPTLQTFSSLLRAPLPPPAHPRMAEGTRPKTPFLEPGLFFLAPRGPQPDSATRLVRPKNPQFPWFYTSARRRPGWHSGEGSACQCRRRRRQNLYPWVKEGRLE